MGLKINVNRDALLGAIQKTLGVAEKRTSPILSNVLLRAGENGKLTIIASDLEISLVSEYDVDVKEMGETTLPAKKLYEMVKEMQGDAIHLAVSDKNVAKITSGKSTYRINGLDAADFPKVEGAGDVKLFPIAGTALKDLISRTSFAMAADEMRKNLAGVLLEASPNGNGNVWKMIATDGHRLAVAKTVTETPCLKLEDVIIPRKGLMEIKKLSNLHEDIKIGRNKNQIIVQGGNTTLKVNLVDASYPEYKRVIPAGNGNGAVMDKETLLRALKRMNVISSEHYTGVTVSLKPDKMALNSANRDVGEAEEEIDIDGFKDEDIVAGFNVKYIIEAVSVMPGDKVLLEINDGMKPALIKPAESLDDIWIHHIGDNDFVLVPACEFYQAMERAGYRVPDAAQEAAASG
jgi:DNA polymerase-3 subunit beta